MIELVKIWKNWYPQDPENQAIVLLFSLVGEVVVMLRSVSFRLFFNCSGFIVLIRKNEELNEEYLNNIGSQADIDHNIDTDKEEAMDLKIIWSWRRI